MADTKKGQGTEEKQLKAGSGKRRGRRTKSKEIAPHRTRRHEQPLQIRPQLLTAAQLLPSGTMAREALGDTEIQTIASAWSRLRCVLVESRAVVIVRPSPARGIHHTSQRPGHCVIQLFVSLLDR